MSRLQREFTEQQIARVVQHPLFKACKADIDAGRILPCLRKGEIHLYERGARLLRFSETRVFTHARYANVPGTRDVPIDDPCKFASIREAARTHRDERPNSELAAVHALFPELAVTRSAHRAGELALIDVEIRFDEDENDATLKGGMIDLAFLLPNSMIIFVEAKCVGNAAISSMDTASVEGQVADYERHIRSCGVREAINRSLSVQSRLVGRDLGQAKCIHTKVPVLVLNPTRNPNPVSKNNHWLRRALANAPGWSPSSRDIGIIDGTSSPVAAIRQFTTRCNSL
jgi:hypothetical protein